MTKRRRSRFRGSVIQSPIPPYAPHPQQDVGVASAVSSIPSIAEDCDVEMGEAIYIPEVDLVDVEMVDDFLPRILSVVVSIYITHGHQPT